MEAFTASLALELAEFDVRVKLVQPGYAPTTRFTSSGSARMAGLITEPYAPFAHRIFATLGQQSAVTRETDVAEAIWRAATDETRARFASPPARMPSHSPKLQ
jgi:NAD(P)-dependent dehydrogenase (short-subunit alcohol dehydrogenase family)